jgi:hypothetical protein
VCLVFTIYFAFLLYSIGCWIVDDNDEGISNRENRTSKNLFPFCFYCWKWLKGEKSKVFRFGANNKEKLNFPLISFPPQHQATTTIDGGKGKEKVVNVHYLNNFYFDPQEQIFTMSLIENRERVADGSGMCRWFFFINFIFSHFIFLRIILLKVGCSEFSDTVLNERRMRMVEEKWVLILGNFLWVT